MKNSRGGKGWTQEEVDYLSDSWGKNTMATISKRLGRTPAAIKIKASKLKLGPFKDGDGVMTFMQLVMVLGTRNSYGWLKEKLLKAGLPVIKQKIYSGVVLKVDIEEFWRWADTHRDLINWSKLELNALGKEPEWVAERRKVDFYNKPNYNRPWRPTEDQQLKAYLENKLTYREIAKKLNRTSLAVRRRCYDLYLTYPKKEIKMPWTREDIETALRLRKEGYSYREIADALGRSQESVRGKIEWELHPEYNTQRRLKRQMAKEMAVSE